MAAASNAPSNSEATFNLGQGADQWVSTETIYIQYASSAAARGSCSRRKPWRDSMATVS